MRFTRASWCRNAAAQLSHTSSARLDAELLLCHCLNISRTTLYTWPERYIDDAQLQRLEHLLESRQQGTPIAYITGTKEFWSLPIHVTPDVLIPRADTEILVEQSLLAYQHAPGPILEMGTGSGAIAIALASELQQIITASDASHAALSVAHSNVEQLVPKQVKLVYGDWGAPFLENTFKIIVSNPPYIPVDDPHLLSAELKHEPLNALTSGNQGLADIERILLDSQRIGTANCSVLLEHGHQQAHAVRELMEKNSYKEVVSVKDLAGHERVTKGICNG